MAGPEEPESLEGKTVLLTCNGFTVIVGDHSDNLAMARLTVGNVNSGGQQEGGP